MITFPKGKWIWLALTAVLVAGAGLIFGNFLNKDYLDQLYNRGDFVLLDQQGEFFQLSKFPENKLLLLVFTPDGIPPADVEPMYRFARHIPKLEGVEVMLITRTNREIVKNFGAAAHFKGRILIDASGTVGRIVGIWPSQEPVGHWGYALIDRDFRTYWVTTASRILTYDEVRERVEKFRPSAKSSSGSP